MSTPMSGWAIIGALGGFVIAMVTIFKKTWSPVTAPLYAVCEGLFIGAFEALKPEFPDVDLNLLRVFDAVMSEQNLTRAAGRLAMTQPAVSNAIRRLRDALNDELLVRTAHGVKPTPRAESLWPAVRRALAEGRPLTQWTRPERVEATAGV